MATSDDSMILKETFFYALQRVAQSIGVFLKLPIDRFITERRIPKKLLS